MGVSIDEAHQSPRISVIHLMGSLRDDLVCLTTVRLTWQTAHVGAVKSLPTLQGTSLKSHSL